MKLFRKHFRIFYWAMAIGFIILNLIAFAHAYKFTHFTNQDVAKTRNAKDLSMLEKVKTLILGIDNPRPTHHVMPTGRYQTVQIKEKGVLRCWRINVDNPRGIVVLFHGFTGEKSQLLTRSEKFMALGYNVLLVDFLGSGDSDGKTTSVGYKEAAQVKACYDFIAKKSDQKIYLFGTSMGAAAIMKAINDYSLTPAGVILECPFGSLYKTVCARFHTMGVPTFPMAALLAFWGGVQSGYWAFSHNPSEYATSISCPVLLLYGLKDDRVSLEETNTIYENLKGPKVLKAYSNQGHDVFTEENVEHWKYDVADFMATTDSAAMEFRPYTDR